MVALLHHELAKSLDKESHLLIIICLHQNLEGVSQGLKSSQDHVIKEAIACRSELADSNTALELAFFR